MEHKTLYRTINYKEAYLPEYLLFLGLLFDTTSIARVKKQVNKLRRRRRIRGGEPVTYSQFWDIKKFTWL